MTDLKQQLLDEVMRIGDELVAQAEFDASGACWQTLTSDEHNSPNMTWHQSPYLYDGVSGIVLFLLELYRVTHDARYLYVASEGARWAEWHSSREDSPYHAFYTGRLGIAFALARMAQITQDSRWLSRASALAGRCRAFLEMPALDNDMLNGASGALLVLLHLHAATGSPDLLSLLDTFAGHIIDGIQPASCGLYWDRSPQAVKGLCGFSHGASGIGFVFLELGHYFQNEAFYWLAEQALGYETQFYDPVRNNWPDLRKVMFRPDDYERYVQAYRAGDLAALTRGRDMNAWCHGAAGIGQSRLRAFELLRRPLYRLEAERAITKTLSTELGAERRRQSFILCHGSSGNADLFLEAHRVFASEAYLEQAMAIAATMLEFKRDYHSYGSGYSYSSQHEDRSLFMGNAGIGYFYLRLLHPEHVPSILAPRLEAVLEPEPDLQSYPSLSLTVADLQRSITRKTFKRTLHLIETLQPESVATHFTTPASTRRPAVADDFIDFAQHLIPSLPAAARKRIAEVFGLEAEKVGMDAACPSHALIYIQSKVQADRAAALSALPQHELVEVRLALNPATKIIRLDWDWDLSTPTAWLHNLHLAPGEHFVLLQQTATEVNEVTLDPFLHIVLMAFARGQHIASALEDILNEIVDLRPSQRRAVEEIVIEQLRQALLSGVLLEA